jgi:putative Mg2+ transporter-C (MgtC) family protein
MPSAFDHIQLSILIDTLISLIGAFILGSLIGFERQYRQRTAGLRTNVLVSVGAALFVDMAATLGGHEGAIHVVAYVVSGIGFLGAGVIMREEGNVRGLNTAATLWGSAAVGACAGADLLIEATLGTAFVLAANTLLRPVADKINRQPLGDANVEATHAVYVISPAAEQKLALGALLGELDRAGYPSRELDIHPFGDNGVEIEVVLTSATVDSDVLDQLVTNLSKHSFVTQAFWSASTSE